MLSLIRLRCPVLRSSFSSSSLLLGGGPRTFAKPKPRPPPETAAPSSTAPIKREEESSQPFVRDVAPHPLEVSSSASSSTTASAAASASYTPSNYSGRRPALENPQPLDHRARTEAARRAGPSGELRRYGKSKSGGTAGYQSYDRSSSSSSSSYRDSRSSPRPYSSGGSYASPSSTQAAETSYYPSRSSASISRAPPPSASTRSSSGASSFAEATATGGDGGGRNDLQRSVRRESFLRSESNLSPRSSLSSAAGRDSRTFARDGDRGGGIGRTRGSKTEGSTELMKDMSTFDADDLPAIRRHGSLHPTDQSSVTREIVWERPAEEAALANDTGRRYVDPEHSSASSSGSRLAMLGQRSDVRPVSGRGRAEATGVEYPGRTTSVYPSSSSSSSSSPSSSSFSSRSSPSASSSYTSSAALKSKYGSLKERSRGYASNASNRSASSRSSTMRRDQAPSSGPSSSSSAEASVLSSRLDRGASPSSHASNEGGRSGLARFRPTASDLAPTPSLHPAASFHQSLPASAVSSSAAVAAPSLESLNPVILSALTEQLIDASPTFESPTSAELAAALPTFLLRLHEKEQLDAVDPEVLSSLRLRLMSSSGRAPTSFELTTALPAHLERLRKVEEDIQVKAAVKDNMALWRAAKLDESWVWKFDREREMGLVATEDELRRDGIVRARIAYRAANGISTGSSSRKKEQREFGRGRTGKGKKLNEERKAEGAQRKLAKEEYAKESAAMDRSSVMSRSYSTRAATAASSSSASTFPPFSRSFSTFSASFLSSTASLSLEQKRPLNPPAWLLHRQALQSSFPAGWSPPKKISREAISLLRLLHQSSPSKYSTPVLAERFKISPEAVRRILKSTFVLSKSEEDRREGIRREEKAKGRLVASSASASDGGDALEVAGDAARGWAGDTAAERREMGVISSRAAQMDDQDATQVRQRARRSS